MTTPENPERLWAAKYRDEDGFEYVAVFERPEHAEESHCHGTDANLQAYVREDVAEAAVANAPGYETAMAEAVRASKLEEETAALRRERDALAAERGAVARAEERAARLRREVCDAIHEYTISGGARHIVDDLRHAVDEYDAEAVARG